MFTATYYYVASSGFYSGTAVSRSPKWARRMAEARAYEALCRGDSAKGVCSGIAAEGWRVYLGTELRGRADLL